MSSIRLNNMMNFGPLTSEIRWRVRGTPANFNMFRVLGSLLHRSRSTEASQTLHDVWPSSALVYYICIFGGSCQLTEFCQLQNSLCVRFFILLNWQHYCTVLEHWCQPKFAAWHKEWNYRTFAEGATYIRQGGHHVGQLPTF